MASFFYENDNATINREITLNSEQTFWKNHTYRRYQLMKDSRAQNNRELKWDEHQKQYEAWRPPKSRDDWQSNIVPPFTTSVVESALSEMIDQTLQPQVQARTSEDVPAATILNKIKEYTWEVGAGDVELYKCIKQVLILGTTVWQEYYLQEKRKVKLIVSYDQKTGQEKYEEREIIDYDDCYGEAVNLWDVYFDPQARSVNLGPYKSQDVIRRYVMHIDTFRNTFAGSKWDKWGMVNKIKPGGDANYYQFYKPPKGIDHGSYVEVIWHWIRNPDRLVIAANDMPFYVGPNPYNHKKLPFGVGQDIVDPWSIYGRGEPALLESIQDELTTNRRMRLDRQKLDVYKMIFVSNRESLTDQDLIPAPMKPVFVEDPRNIQAFEYGDINPSAYREEMLLKEDGQRVTGIDDRAQGVSPKAGTATEAAILKEATLKRLKTKIWYLSRTLLMEQIQLRVPNIMQFYKTPKIIDITGQNSIEKMMKIRELAESNRLFQKNGKFYEMQFKTIVTKNKELKRRDKELLVLDKRGDNFFMVTPDLLTTSGVGFNYKLSAEPTFPASKPLLQQKMNELFQHPIIQAAVQQGYYDVSKIADKMTEMSDFDPDDFISGAQSMDQTQASLADPQKMIEYASRENEMMAKGETLVGTPFSTPEHTQIHLAYMRSESFKSQASQEILRIFTRHVLEEATSQRMRLSQQQLSPQQQQPQQGTTGEGQGAGIMAGDAKAAMPAQVRGSEMLPDFTS